MGNLFLKKDNKENDINGSEINKKRIERVKKKYILF